MLTGVLQDSKVIQDLTTYLAKKTPPTLPTLPSLLSPSSPAQIGLILTERFINMPHEIIPPMYTMLREEIQWARDASEPYNFTHYLVLSKCYSEIQSQLRGDEAPRGKKGKKGGQEGGGEVFYFHPEDEVLHKHALGYGGFEYDTPVDEGASDSKRAFQELGVRPMGHLTLIEAGRFEGAVEAVKVYLGGQ